MRQIARDPFARHTSVREVVRPLRAHQTCGFCGGIRVTRSQDPFLYRYDTEPDAIRTRVSWHDGIFCSKSCHDALAPPPHRALYSLECAGRRLGALLLDARGRIITEREVFVGTPHTALVSIRDVPRLALSQHGRGVVVFHNHLR